MIFEAIFHYTILPVAPAFVSSNTIHIVTLGPGVRLDVRFL